MASARGADQRPAAMVRILVTAARERESSERDEACAVWSRKEQKLRWKLVEQIMPRVRPIFYKASDDCSMRNFTMDELGFWSMLPVC